MSGSCVDVTIQPSCCDGDTSMVAHVKITKAKPRSRVTISTSGAAIHHICIEFTVPSEHMRTEDSFRTHYAGFSKSRMA